MMDLPDKFIRGIKSSSELDDDGVPAASVFMFDDKLTKPERNLAEISINWVDNDKVMENTLKEESTKFPGELLYKKGVAVLSTEEYHKICTSPNNKQNGLHYERDKLPDKPYHGNLLLQIGTNKRVKLRIAYSIIQTCFIEIIENKH